MRKTVLAKAKRVQSQINKSNSGIKESKNASNWNMVFGAFLMANSLVTYRFEVRIRIPKNSRLLNTHLGPFKTNQKRIQFKKICYNLCTRLDYGYLNWPLILITIPDCPLQKASDCRRFTILWLFRHLLSIFDFFRG